jgi:hypothetical protein
MTSGATFMVGPNPSVNIKLAFILHLRETIYVTSRMTER